MNYYNLVPSRSVSLHMLHSTLRSMRSSLQQLHRRQLLKLLLEYWVPPVVYRGGYPLRMQLCVCVLFPYPRISTKTSQVMGLPHRPPHGGGGHSAWCAWLAKDLDRPVHHACEFSARLMGGRMLEIQSFLLTSDLRRIIGLID